MPKRTPSGKPTAVAEVEDKLKAEYPDDPGAVYGTLNKAGLMHGNKTTAKGAKTAKHDAKGKPLDSDGDRDSDKHSRGGLAVHDSMADADIHGRDRRHTSETR